MSLEGSIFNGNIYVRYASVHSPILSSFEEDELIAHFHTLDKFGSVRQDMNEDRDLSDVYRSELVRD